MTEKPDWCGQIGCQCFYSMRSCVLKEWVLKSTPLTSARSEKFKDFRRLAKHEPEELRSLCQRKVADVSGSDELIFYQGKPVKIRRKS